MRGSPVPGLPEHDHFPQTYIFIEGDKGSLQLGPDYWIRVTTREGTLSRRVPPPRKQGQTSLAGVQALQEG